MSEREKEREKGWMELKMENNNGYLIKNDCYLMMVKNDHTNLLRIKHMSSIYFYLFLSIPIYSTIQ